MGTFELELEPSEGRPARLDRALVDALAAAGEDVSRARLAKAFERGWVVAADGGRALKPSLKVDRPMRVSVQIPPPEALSAQAEEIPLDVLFEDEHIVVVDKPAHMAVHAGPGHERGTLVNAVLHHLGAQADSLPVLPGNESYRPGLVHRLDRDTSGVMVLAKHARAMTGLAEQFRVHDIERVYLGVCGGVPNDLPEGKAVKVVTGHGRDPKDRRRFAPVPLGPGVREAVTIFRVERRMTDDLASLVSFRLETGRTHQIRMHARHLGAPILGDELYGHRARDEHLAQLVATLGRQALHAAVLGFRHPMTSAEVRYESPLPTPIRTLLAAL